MTLALLPLAPSAPPDTPAALLERQLAGMAAWHAHRHSQVPAQASASREMRLDAARRADVLLRVQEAVLTASAADLALAETPCAVVGRRAVVVHRNAWFREKVAGGLAAAGVRVVAALDNGADGLGTAVAEQPDLLVLEDSLPMMGAEELLAHCRTMAPETRVVVQVGYEDRVPALLAAGAAAAWSRRVPPADVVEAAAALLG